MKTTDDGKECLHLSEKTNISGDTKNFLLEDLLDSSKKTRIKSIADRYGVKLSEKNTKQQMIAAVLPAIEVNFGVKLRQYTPEELHLAMDCFTENALSESAADLVMHSAPFLDGAVYLIGRKDGFYPAVPHELAGRLMMRCVTECFGQSGSPLERCAAACAALYGSFTPGMLADAASHAFGCEFTRQQAEQCLLDADAGAFTYRGGIASAAAETPPEIRAESADTDYYLPTQREIESYAAYGADTGDYYYRQIVNFIFNNTGISYDRAKELMRHIAAFCSGDADSFLSVLKELEQSGLVMNDEKLNYLVGMIAELSNRTRKPSLKGHRPDEIEGIPPVSVPHVQTARAKPEPLRVEQKIGRNDPCPCGSGKKYKKCCGKNQ